MSLARRALLASTRSTTPWIVPRQRAASSSSHAHHEDAEYNTSEGFITPFWRNAVLATAVGVAAYEFAPAPDDTVYLTQWIAMYTEPRERWLAINLDHTVQQLYAAETTLLLNDANKPKVHRFRYPQALMHGSPFLNAVGEGVDMKDVVVKGSKDV